MLDLRRVALTTQSYAHALVAAPLRSLDVDAGERLRVACSSPQVKQVFRTVLRYLRDESG